MFEVSQAVDSQRADPNGCGFKPESLFKYANEEIFLVHLSHSLPSLFMLLDDDNNDRRKRRRLNT
ncbi:CLUMA_CG019914, isoform A [Clunio marinus]|uniref:CLUMA_CG019914, isoform A n=1 Tax=Clunio marinus TaxID=568069 RepID=A0A1J1J3Y5_9DIPT|nr:CLUMA_CG019914, isoform A [Clunio marinus]